MPITTLVENYILIDWTAPFDGGANIWGYQIVISSSLNIFSEELTTCDGSLESITAATQCIVYLADLRASPYSLSLGATIYVKIRAYNYYGYSDYSALANN
jgi:hypothetical protein